MPEFILDTSGVISVESAHGCALDFKWGGLSDLAQGYTEALFFTESEGSIERGDFDPENGSALPEESGFASLDRSALETIVADCAAFERLAAAELALAYETGDYDATQAGRDFWFTRNGHGVGFWDRDALESEGLGAKLTAHAKTFGEVSAYWDAESESVFLD